MADLIDRAAALNCFHSWTDRYGDVHTPDEMAEYRAIEELPSVEPERTNCTDCTDYDHETHSCPKYCEVIRETVEEVKERTGRWMATEADEPCFYRCSKCGRLIDERENFCPNCGSYNGGE